MTSAPIEPAPGADGPGTPPTDLGVGGPAEDTGPEGAPTQPPGYPESVDAAEGPVPD